MVPPKYSSFHSLLVGYLTQTSELVSFDVTDKATHGMDLKVISKVKSLQC